MSHKTLLPTLLLGAFLIVVVGCEGLQQNERQDTVAVPRSEYQELKRRAELEKRYEATFQTRREVLAGRRRGDKVFLHNALFNACGDILDPNGEIYDPKNWPDAPLPSASTTTPSN